MFLSVKISFSSTKLHFFLKISLIKPISYEKVIALIELKPLNKLMSDLLSINYYNKHKEESILEQFYI